MSRPPGGVKIQKVGAIYTRTLEEGGAIYFDSRSNDSLIDPPNGQTGDGFFLHWRFCELATLMSRKWND